MTNAEAIRTLKLMQAQIEWDYPMEYSAAIDEAINALEAQEKAQKVSNNSSELDNNFGELISRQAANYKICNACGMIDCDQMDKCKKVFTAQPEKCTETHSCDLISRKMVLALPRNKVRSLRTYEVVEETINVTDIEHLPSAQPEWNNHTVACMLAELFDDTCACNYNGIDEWLPEKCEVIDACPNPVGVACWEQFLKHRAERRTDE